jgi:hypothetical protein
MTCSLEYTHKNQSRDFRYIFYIMTFAVCRLYWNHYMTTCRYRKHVRSLVQHEREGRSQGGSRGSGTPHYARKCFIQLIS